MAEESSFITPYSANVPSGHRQIGRGYQKTVIVDHEPERLKSPDIPTKAGDRHLIISLIMLIVSICNPFALPFAVLAVICSVKSRSAELAGKKADMQSKDKIAFGFVIFSMIAWIVSICMAIIATYITLCGPGLTGVGCPPPAPPAPTPPAA